MGVAWQGSLMGGRPRRQRRRNPFLAGEQRDPGPDPDSGASSSGGHAIARRSRRPASVLAHGGIPGKVAA